MKNISEILEYLQTVEEKSLNFDYEAIFAEYKDAGKNQSLSVKILSVFGGILASLAFLGFLTVTKLFDSAAGLLIFGSFCIAGAALINIKFNTIITDTLSVSFFIIGFILLGFGFDRLEMNHNVIYIIFIITALCSLFIVRNYIISFISVTVINGCILMLIITGKNYDLIHLYVSVIAVIFTYYFLKEAKIITIKKVFSKLYNPVRAGLTFSFLAGLVLLGKKGLFLITYDCIWLSSIIIISAIVYLAYILFDILNITKIQYRIPVCIFTVLALLPTALSPAISGALLIILLSFLVNYKTGLSIGIISFIYFISLYYYDLNFTLLTKSMLLFSSGIIFIILYLFTRNQLMRNEKV